MRLTLRTLLAYLDDTLEPAPAKEIGQKLKETPIAQELVARIKEVTRRRRVTAPPVTGDDIDPNTLSEYLDNLLPPELVAQLENHCLESDVHLAEVAACHQILTLIGQPAGVNDTMRQRMYQLVHAIESIPPDQRLVAIAPEPAVAPSVFAQRPMLARVLTAAAIALGAIGITWLVWVSLPPRDSGGLASRATDASDSDKPSNHFIPTRRNTDVDDVTSTPSSPASDMPVENTDVAETDVNGAAARTVPESTEPPEDAPRDHVPVIVPPAEHQENMPVSTRPLPGETVADSVPDAAEAPPVAPPKPEPPIAPPPVVLATYSSASGVLLHASESTRDWRRFRARSDIHEGVTLLGLPSYRAALQAPSGATIDMVGECELMLVAPAEGVDAYLKMNRGRLVLGMNQGKAVFQIDFLKESWRLTLDAPEHVVGVTVMPVWRPGGPFTYDATVIVPRGEVQLEAAGTSYTLGGPVQLRWSSSDGMQEKESLSVSPSWLEREELTPSEVRAAAALEEDLPMDGPIAVALVDATANERKELRILGVKCLGAIGRLPALIDAMNTMGRRDMRQEAIASLRRYLARGDSQEEPLRQALIGRARALRFRKPEEFAQGVIDLLRGYSDAEFQQLQKKAYEDLIQLLSPDWELLIRELAIMNLEDLAGKPLNSNYDPDKPKDSDIAAWKRALTDGRLPPKVRGKM